MSQVDAFGRCTRCGRETDTAMNCIYCATTDALLFREGVQPHKCPVCDGTGKVSRPPGTPGDIPHWSSSSIEVYDCQACKSSGIVWGPP